VQVLCRTLGVSPSGFYASRTRPESRRAQEDRRLKVLLHASFTGGRGYYGSPRIHDDFIEWGEHVSRKRIIRLKQEEGLKARVRKRYKVTTDSDHDQPIAQSAPTRLHGRPTQSTVGRRHQRAAHRRERESLPGGDPRFVFAIRRGLGDQRRE